MKNLFLATLLFALPTALFSQKKQPLEFDDYQKWRHIENREISADGRFVSWTLAMNTEGDPVLQLFSAEKNATESWPRGDGGKFSDDANWFFFKIKPPLDTLKKLRRKKTKDEDLPNDTLAILNLQTRQLTKIANVKNFSVPERWSGHLVFLLEADGKKGAKKDTASVKKSFKKEGKENGNRLIIRNLSSEKQDTVPFVIEVSLAKNRPRLAVISTGRDSVWQAGAYFFDLEKNACRPLCRGRGEFKNIALDEAGAQAAFVADRDTSKAQLREAELFYFSEKMDSARLALGRDDKFLKVKKDRPRHLVSRDFRPNFSDNGEKLFFGLAPLPFLPDTNLLPEETVKMDLWAWTDGQMMTEQINKLDDEKRRSFAAVYRILDEKLVALGSGEVPEIRFSPTKNSDFAVGFSGKNHEKLSGWEGGEYRDLHLIDQKTGDKTLISSKLRASPLVSPEGGFISWFSEVDSSWFCFDIKNARTRRLTDNTKTTFFNEEDDTPDFPSAWGAAGWLTGDAGLVVYDKFDLWLLDPTGGKGAERLTGGREKGLIFRKIKLDLEEKSLSPGEKWLLHQKDDRAKSEGYALFDFKTKKCVQDVRNGGFSFSKSPLKARRGDALIFSKENFDTFPDILFEPDSSDVAQKISDANPQQKNHHWGSAELVHWPDAEGREMTGMLFKPDGFRADRAYPMVVNFYEKSSDGLFAHRAPEPGRSQINYTYYTSRGYLVFNPDIPYEIGRPGESALKAVVSGTEFLIKQGFVDRNRIGLQGHSWGGYQIAYIVTRTGMFACAESGAPVVNMTSAYGGIRWESGKSRSFQYEHQQSRIGGTLWEKPGLFLENSPLFSLPRVQTPVLILHNDKDGAVPWQQGIEFFTGLRRLGKPCWMLNYNDEPHWPVKLQNRLDFQKRMEQFFDHYLKGDKMPEWMERGIPAVEGRR